MRTPHSGKILSSCIVSLIRTKDRALAILTIRRFKLLKMQEPPSTQSLIDQKLIRSGEKDRLKEYLRQRLIDCGWRDQMKAYAKDIVMSRPHESMNVEDIVQEVSGKGRAVVPDSVKADLLLRVRKILQDQEA
ncbi:transcription factor e(y)2-domain-containing protein [Powellomyces hirtus]|nr:transcription factor e(y)2-domain-containing protein [Powellomyces hirtus]